MRDFDCNHFIFEGPAGVGKRTMIRAMLQEAFGQERVQVFFFFFFFFVFLKKIIKIIF
jgi:DNA replication protein DnaC